MCGQRRPPLQRVRVGNTHSDLHQFLFLLGAHLVDLLDVLVGEVLDILFGLLLVVLGDLAVLLRLLYLLYGIAADGADGNLGFFTLLLDGLGQFLAPFLGQFGEYKATALAVVGRIAAKIGLLYGLFQRIEHRRIIGVITSSLASGEEMLPTWLTGVGVP